MEDIQKKLFLTPLVMFTAGLVVVMIGVHFDSVRHIFSAVEGVGYIGAFISGIIYATAFTSSSATVILAQMPEYLNPYLVAMVASLGSALYDLSIFTLFRSQQKRKLVKVITDRLHHTSRAKQWLMTIAGLLIIASPLPDELSAGLLSFSKMSSRKFILISFLANAVGILAIVLIGR